ncbi:MAG: thioredoxin family protein [Gemmatimonadaceae bacterium]
MRLSPLVFVLIAAGSLGAQGNPVPLPPTDLALAYARAMPYRQFLATDTTRAADWAAADGRAAASVAEFVRVTPPPAGQWRLLVVAENGCSDALASLPYLAQLAAQMPAGELRILRRADGAQLVAARPFNGRSATPLVFVLDSAFGERGVWYERASHIQAYVLANEGKVNDDSLWARVRVMRREDDGRTPLREVMALMRGATSPAVTPAESAKAKPKPQSKPQPKLLAPCKAR